MIGHYYHHYSLNMMGAVYNLAPNWSAKYQYSIVKLTSINQIERAHNHEKS